MILYKYLSPERLDVLLNCKIRFTQYGDFNDPFELNPNINKLAEEDEIRKLVKKDFVQLIEDEYENNPVVHPFISKKDFITLAKTQETAVKNGVLGMERHVVRWLPGILQNTANSLLGALSLSEIYNHELMWSHYADEHKGYVIGFDTKHPFFNQRKSDEDELRHLRKIEYSDERPEINLMETDVVELFFTKSSKWSYESEWRMVLPLSDFSEKIEKEPYPIHLFKFPPEAIASVILGIKMNVQHKAKIRATIENNPEFLHIEFYKANLKETSFEISIAKIGG
jgi:hypothetical protein